MNSLFPSMQFLTDSATGSTSGGSSTLIMVLYIVIIFGLLYFVMIRPQKKKQKEEEKLRSNVQVGDEVITIGGINGRVISMKEENITIESPADHSKITLEKWAIQTNKTQHEAEALEKPQKKSKKEKVQKDEQSAE